MNEPMLQFFVFSAPPTALLIRFTYYPGAWHTAEKYCKGRCLFIGIKLRVLAMDYIHQNRDEIVKPKYKKHPREWMSQCYNFLFSQRHPLLLKELRTRHTVMLSQSYSYRVYWIGRIQFNSIQLTSSSDMNLIGSNWLGCLTSNPEGELWLDWIGSDQWVGREQIALVCVYN